MSETAFQWRARMAEIERQNIARGLCGDCGGTGVVANLSSSDPHANLRCRRCNGDGKARLRRATPPDAEVIR